MTRFRFDNTVGYDAAGLARLNHEFERRVGNGGDTLSFDELDWIAEQVLADYDTELAHGYGHGTIVNGTFH